MMRLSISLLLVLAFVLLPRTARADACSDAGLEGAALAACQKSIKPCQYQRGARKQSCEQKAVDKAKAIAPTKETSAGAAETAASSTIGDSAPSCDDAGLVEPYLEWCKKKMAGCEDLRGPSKTRCQTDAVKRNQERAADDQRKKNAETAAAAEWAECSTEEYETICRDLNDRRNDLCFSLRSIPLLVQATPEESLQTAQGLISRLEMYEALLPALDDWEKRYGRCESAPTDHRNCLFAATQISECRNARPEIIAAWASYVDDFEKKSLPALDEEIAKLQKRKGATTSTENWFVESRVGEIEQIRRVNDSVKWIQTDPAKVSRLEEAARKKLDTVSDLFAKSIASTKCPGATNPDGTLTPKLNGVLTKHFAATKSAGSTMEVSVKRFGLTGKGVQKRVPFMRVTHEDIPGFTCVEQKRGGKTDCRIFQVTFRRSKPDGGSWGAWQFYSIGGGQLMACKNL